mmetsp:Transcript_38645/g.74091  ORF Transcript_38645/g.74091 Transcript_38645/m.74091 type:complete len:220 (+) Transcript_38645:567-1226(+)
MENLTTRITRVQKGQRAFPAVHIQSPAVSSADGVDRELHRRGELRVQCCGPAAVSAQCHYCWHREGRHGRAQGVVVGPPQDQHGDERDTLLQPPQPFRLPRPLPSQRLLPVRGASTQRLHHHGEVPLLHDGVLRRGAAHRPRPPLRQAGGASEGPCQPGLQLLPPPLPARPRVHQPPRTHQLEPGHRRRRERARQPDAVRRAPLRRARGHRQTSVRGRQ